MAGLVRVKQAVILCGGKGSRLAPLTDEIPKVLVEINGKSILEYKLELLKELVEEVILIIGYKKEKIIEKFGEDYFGLKISYVVQEIPEGTGHALLQAKILLKDEFIVLNGDDYYSKEDLKKLLSVKFGMFGWKVTTPSKWGILEIDLEDNLIEIEEKPANPKSNLANIGAYAFSVKIFEKELIKSTRGEYEIVDYLNYLVSVGEKVKVLEAKVWIYINDFEELEEAKKKINPKTL